MPVTAMLKQDHAVRRRKPDFLEAALQPAPQSVFVLREMCHSPTTVLDAPIRGESD